MYNNEFSQLFLLVIEELNELVEYNAKAVTYKDDDYSWGWDCEMKTDPKYMRSISISCISRKTSMVFDFNDGEMTVNIDGASHALDVGRGSQYPELKSSFFKLYKRVKNYWTVQNKKEEEEEFVKRLYINFPHLMDKILLGSENEE